MRLLWRVIRKPWAVAATFLIIAGCSDTLTHGTTSSNYYTSAVDQGFEIKAIPRGKVPNRFLRRIVSYPALHSPGSIVVDPGEKYLYFIETGGRAVRYGVGVGIGAFAWNGEAIVGRKAAWPVWTPPREMVARSPSLSLYGRGLKAGPLNPLGARAIYLHQGGRDTLYRLHGTSEWWSIGQAASSGCIRMLNQDIIDLYQRVDVGTKVVVLPDKLRISVRKRVPR